MNEEGGDRQKVAGEAGRASRARKQQARRGGAGAGQLCGQPLLSKPH